MYFDIFLLSVLLVTGYLGPIVVRRNPPGQRLYGWLLIADLGCAVVALYARNTSGMNQGHIKTGDLLGVIAIGAAVFLVLVPPMLRDLARRAVLSDRLHLARWLVNLRELLQPHMGAERDRELIEAIMAVRAGRVDDVIALLIASREQIADPVARQKIDERIVLTYLSARRWQEAVDAYEVGFSAAMLSPQLAVEMVRAYCETGNLRAAASLVEQLESSPMAREPLLAFMLYRARLVFLAFSGRTAAVEGILGPSGPLGAMPAATRHYWSGVARLHAGDRTGARSSLERAARLARRDRRAREVAENLIASIDQPGVAGPHALEPDLVELADRLATRAADISDEPRVRVPQMAGVRLGRLPVTLALIVANLAIFGLVMVLFGSTGDPGGLFRAGANVKSAVKAGELWRLGSSMFLHVGFLHLLLNMYALWILGKLLEQMYGSLRLFGLYMLAGLAGALASALVGDPGISAGASGAVLGLLGALIAELGLRRRLYPERWRALLLGNLVFVAVAQVGIGFIYQAIDQSAHVGGLVAGALLAVIVAPTSRLGTKLPVRVLAGILGVAGAAVIAYGLVGVAGASYASTLARQADVEQTSGGLVFVGPAGWQSTHNGDELVRIELGIERQVPALGLPDILEQLGRDEVRREQGASQVALVPVEERLALPAPWHGTELEVRIDGMGGTQRYRVVIFGRLTDGELWLGRMDFPALIAAEMEPVLGKVLGSVRRVGR